MTILDLGSSDITSLLTATVSFLTADDNSDKGTTVACAATTISSAISCPNQVHIYMTQNYIDALTDEQLSQAVQMIEQKESTLPQVEIKEPQKVFQKKGI